MSWIVIVAAVLTPGQSGRPPESSFNSDQAAVVRQLIRKLNDDRIAEREAAQEKLEAMGPAVLEWLPETTEDVPPEVRRRVGEIRQTLQQRRVADEISAGRVQLSGQFTVTEALESLMQQTGNTLTGYQGRPGTVRLDGSETLFWPVLDQILDQAQLDLTSFGGEPRTLTLTSRPDQLRPRYGAACYAGAFRVEAVQVQATRHLRDARLNGLQLTVAVQWEPRLAPISLRQPMTKVRATDDLGNVIVPSQSEAVLNAPLDGRAAGLQWILSLKLPQRQATRIAQLDGTLRVTLPGGLARFRFPDPKSPGTRSQRHTGVTVQLESCRRTLAAWEIQLRVRFDQPADALESYRGWIFRNPTYLVDQKGRSIAPKQTRLIGQRTDEVRLAALFDVPDIHPDDTLVYESPAAIVSVDVDYSLKDIPLP